MHMILMYLICFMHKHCVSKLRHISETKEVTALLDTGCLVGDCISQGIIKSLNTFNYLFDTNTTICSGFHNTYAKKKNFFSVP
jgi:hypothetical protein